MYAILTGTAVGKSEEVNAIANALINVATKRAYESATSFRNPSYDPQYRGTISNWEAEFLVPDSKECDFIIAVLAPRELGISPIGPFFLDVSGPLFSAILWEKEYIVMEQGKDPVSLQTADKLEEAFNYFIHGKRKVNEYVKCSLCGASVNKKRAQKHQNEKCHSRLFQ